MSETNAHRLELIEKNRLTADNGQAVPGRFTALDWARDTFIPNPSRSDGIATPAVKAVLFTLATKVNDSLVCWPTFQQVAATAQMRKQAVVSELSLLKRTRMLVTVKTMWENNGKDADNVYVLNVSGWLDDVDCDPALVAKRLEFLEQASNVANCPPGRRFRV